MEKLIYQITNELKCLEEYVKAMQKVEDREPRKQDLENLQMHITNLKAWAGMNDNASNVIKSGCKIDSFEKGTCNKYFGWCEKEKCEYWQTVKTPEELMNEGFENLSKTRELFGEAFKAYNTRSDFVKADPENAANVKSALHYLAAAYDEVSAIWENDINI
jgi:hypothetical protein